MIRTFRCEFLKELTVADFTVERLIESSEEEVDFLEVEVDVIVDEECAKVFKSDESMRSLVDSAECIVGVEQPSFVQLLSNLLDFDCVGEYSCERVFEKYFCLRGEPVASGDAAVEDVTESLFDRDEGLHELREL